MLIYKVVKDINNEYVPIVYQEVFDVLEKYFNMLQDGTCNTLLPDPFYKMEGFDDVKIEHLIEIIDKDLLTYENWRLGDISGFNGHPDFCRLPNGAKEAMVQDIHKVIKYQRSHEKEYYEEIMQPTLEEYFDDIEYVD